MGRWIIHYKGKVNDKSEDYVRWSITFDEKTLSQQSIHLSSSISKRDFAGIHIIQFSFWLFQGIPTPYWNDGQSSSGVPCLPSFPQESSNDLLRKQGSCINSGSDIAISADSIQRMKNADAALQHSAATPLTPCSGPVRLNGSSRLIQKETFNMSDRIPYIYIATLWYKNPHWHHNTNLRKGGNKTG